MLKSKVLIKLVLVLGTVFLLGFLFKQDAHAAPYTLTTDPTYSCNTATGQWVVRWHWTGPVAPGRMELRINLDNDVSGEPGAESLVATYSIPVSQSTSGYYNWDLPLANQQYVAYIYFFGYASSTVGVTATDAPCGVPSNTLNVQSSPITNVNITGTYPGTTNYSETVNGDINATLTAPATSGTYNFSSWSGCNSTSARDCTVSVTGGGTKTVTANYTQSPGTLVVRVFDDSGNKNGRKDSGESDINCPIPGCATLVTRDSAGGLAIPRTDATFMVFGDASLSPNNYSVFLKPDGSTWAITSYSYQTPTSGLVTAGYAGPSSSWYNTVGIPVIANGTTTVYLGMKKISATTINVTVFNDDGNGCEGNGVKDCPPTEQALTDTFLITNGLKVSIDGGPALTSTGGNPSFTLPGGDVGASHYLTIHSYKVDDNTVWVTTKWSNGGGVGSGTTYNNVSSQTYNTDPFTMATKTVNIYLGVRKLNFDLSVNPTALRMVPTSDSKTISVNPVWTPDSATDKPWPGTSPIQVFVNCPEITSTAGLSLKDNFTVNTCPPNGTSGPSSTKAGLGTVVFTLTSSSVSVPSKTFDIQGLTSIQGQNLNPKKTISLNFSYPAWVRTKKGNIGSRGEIIGNYLPAGCPTPAVNCNSQYAIITPKIVDTNFFKSAKDWVVKPYDINLPDPKDYASFDRLFKNERVNGPDKSRLPKAPGKYLYNDGFTWTGATAAGSCNPAKKDAIVIFVDNAGVGKNKMLLNPSSKKVDLNCPTVFIASGEIWIDASVTSVKAILVADGTILDSSGNSKLTVNGAIIGALTGGSVGLYRDLGAANQTQPAEDITLDPSYFWYLSSKIGKTKSTFMEVRP